MLTQCTFTSLSRARYCNYGVMFVGFFNAGCDGSWYIMHFAEI